MAPPDDNRPRNDSETSGTAYFEIDASAKAPLYVRITAADGAGNVAAEERQIEMPGQQSLNNALPAVTSNQALGAIAQNSAAPATQVPFQMFVLRYVDGGATWASTATSPVRRRYEVRAIDLASGSLTNPLQLRTKLTVAQEMNAEPLGAVTSTAMSMVFSLYRGTEDGDSELAPNAPVSAARGAVTTTSGGPMPMAALRRAASSARASSSTPGGGW